jgi:hypothetical protein
MAKHEFNALARENAKKAQKVRWDRVRAAKQAGNAAVAEICSAQGVKMENLSVESIEIIKRLQADLAIAKSSIPASERLAVAAAEQQGHSTGTAVREIFTGEYVEVEKGTADPNIPPKYEIVGYENKRPILKPIMVKARLPVYAYKIDLAPAGGEYISINGTRYYHGMVAKFDEDTLRTVKEIVYRGWDHERNTHGSDENAYRPKSNRSFSARGSA